ncbi:phosphoglycerate kinase [Chromohalobacter canadensis]|uniref:Phosphoglycerate kinase n=1 Tax=Chromohalobacter canadensis TaxID=141389 RepID=A0A285VF26_9GAMM|nr:phosphoglycerate kinase [Chromohalobacter canadensis]
MNVRKMTDLDLAGKRVLIREDLNVPIKGDQVTSDARLRACLPTIQAAPHASGNARAAIWMPVQCRAACC